MCTKHGTVDTTYVRGGPLQETLKDVYKSIFLKRDLPRVYFLWGGSLGYYAVAATGICFPYES